MTNILTAALVFEVVTNWSGMYNLYPPDRPIPCTIEAAYITTNVYVSCVYWTKNGSRVILVTEVERIMENNTNSVNTLRREVPAVTQQFPRSWQVTP